jgi:hypothetical protein
MLKIVEGSTYRPFPFVKKPEEKKLVATCKARKTNGQMKMERKIGAFQIIGTPNGGGRSRTPLLAN